jgi:hypothetical protein
MTARWSRRSLTPPANMFVKPRVSNWRDMRSKKPRQEAIRDPAAQLSPEAAHAANRFIRETDWDAFWSHVMQRASLEIDAYERTRAKSLASAPGHVFL